jgi:hypothetical protein
VRRIGLKNCPYCGSSKVYISAPKTLRESLSALFLLRLVRCHGCMRRHVRPLLLPAPKHPELYAVPTKPVAAVFAQKTEKPREQHD